MRGALLVSAVLAGLLAAFIIPAMADDNTTVDATCSNAHYKVSSWICLGHAVLLSQLYCLHMYQTKQHYSSAHPQVNGEQQNMGQAK